MPVMHVRLMLGLSPGNNSFFRAVVLMVAALKLPRPPLDPQVVPNHVAEHRNKPDDQQNVNHLS